MNKIIRKLKSTCGETLVETIAAILIVTLASAVFLTMSSISVSTNETAIEMQEAFYSQLSEASLGQGTDRAQIFITEIGTGGIDVVYTGGEGKLTVYKTEDNL